LGLWDFFHNFLPMQDIKGSQIVLMGLFMLLSGLETRRQFPPKWRNSNLTAKKLHKPLRFLELSNNPAAFALCSHPRKRRVPEAHDPGGIASGV